MLDNTGGGGKTNNVRQYRGREEEKTMLDNTGEGKDKQC
jgi:hypothetical protein